MSQLIKEARYVMANVDNNNNKYWYAFLYDDGTFETHWNRVGETPNKTIKNGCSESTFNSKCKEKEKKGYSLLNTLADGGVVAISASTKQIADTKLEEVARNQIKYNDPLVEQLISRLSKENIHNIVESTKITYNSDSGLFSTPLGIVTQQTVDEARNILTNIGQYIINDNVDSNDYKTLFNNYCMHIPQDIGRQKLDPSLIFPDISAVQNQNSILDSLEVSIQSVLDGIKVDNQDNPMPQLFDVKLELVNDSNIYDRITKKFLDTMHNSHASSHLRPKVIYSVDIRTMADAFERKGKQIGNTQFYWHGTRVSNVLSILKSGLQIPPARASFVCGRMFSDGAYFSDQSTKSLNYSYGYWDGKSKDNNPFMFLADVAMGKTYVPKGTGDGPFPKPGYDSVSALAGKSGVQNNEFIVYDIAQTNLRYLVEFSPSGK